MHRVDEATTADELIALVPDILAFTDGHSHLLIGVILNLFLAGRV
jgi:hypothetical protein